MKKLLPLLFLLAAGCASVKDFDPGETPMEQFSADQAGCEAFADDKIKHTIGGYDIRNTSGNHADWINHYNICMKSKGYKVKN